MGVHAYNNSIFSSSSMGIFRAKAENDDHTDVSSGSRVPKGTPKEPSELSVPYYGRIRFFSLDLKYILFLWICS